MKLEDFETAAKLIEVRERIIDALVVIDMRTESQKTPQAIPGIMETGYRMNISTHIDGSGRIVNLDGCYVAEEVIVATRKVLEDKLVTVENEMKRIGIEF